MDPDSENELFLDAPDKPVSATVGDVINLDSVSQDSVPLDDTISQGTDTSQEATGLGREEETGQTETTGEAQETKVGSPKPFDASLFGEATDIVSTASSDGFPIKTQAATTESVHPAVDESLKEDVTNLESLKVEVKRQSSVDGFESQPIGSPGAQFQFTDSEIFGEESFKQSLGTETTTAGDQPAISSFFKEEEVASDSGTEDKNFFDSFTSGGDGFQGSMESPRLDEDNKTVPEENLLGQDLPSDPSIDLSKSPSAGFTEELSFENKASSQDVTSTKQTLLELSQEGPAANSDTQEQTLSPHSPLPEVTSPHVCSVQNQGEGNSFEVAFAKNHSTSSSPKTPEAPPVSETPQPVPQAPVGAPKQPPAQPYPPPSQLPRLFSPSHSIDDSFTTALTTSQSDRRHDAWLPSIATQNILNNRMSALQGTEYVDRAQLTMPGIILEEQQGDPVKELVYRYMGDAEASKRVALTVNQVTRDDEGLKKLLDTGCLRAALELTGMLLTSLNQGKGQAGLPSKHTPRSFQIWLTRIALLIKLQQYSMAEVECEAFGNLDRPDIYFEYYPDLFPGRKGSMVPFSLRVLHAELPLYLGKHQDSLNRLYHVLDITSKILYHLECGLSEYGTEIELTEENRQASVDLWKSREVRVMYSIGNCLLSMKDFKQSVAVYEKLLIKDAKNESSLLSGIGRIFLQLGDLKSAQEAFTRAEKSYHGNDSISSKAIILMNKAFMQMAQNQYPEARKYFDEVLKIDPENFKAINNQSVCLLYMGKLKEALSLLEKLVHGNPSKYLDEGLLFNLCTLYELDSSRSTQKKQALLGMVNQIKGDGFNKDCLKML
ncbi:trafficking protein particle complex subunit 12-like [Asterias amurensis]|uniref:trafficking protein particle complex subunit 12-like n=1 Tax=Asterias amurensis TaxID=7602 RepID=UPI003AB56BA7